MLQVEHIAKTFGETGPGGCQSPGQPRGCRRYLRTIRFGENDLSPLSQPLRKKADSGRLTLAGKTYDLAKLSKKDILEIRQKQPLFSNTTISLQTKLLWKIF